MGAGCCGGYTGTEYSSTTGPNLYGISTGQTGLPGYGVGDARRYDSGKHINNPLAHMHDFYRPKASMRYERPEDMHTSTRMQQAAEKLLSPEAKYGTRQAKILYWNVSGI